MLVHYNDRLPLYLACDASSYGAGCVLSHHINNQDRPIAFASCALTDVHLSSLSIFSPEHLVAPSYSMCFDNVGIEENARNQGQENKTVHIWTSAYATMDRVDELLEIQEQSSCTLTHRIGINHFLQSGNNIMNRKTRMIIIVQRILKGHFAYFESSSVEEHIQLQLE